VLEPSEVEAAREAMDEKDFNEQFGAMWETVSGLVYYGFDATKSLSNWAYDPSKAIVVGSDFNVDPMAWVMMQQGPTGVHVFDELWLRNTNTEATLDELHKRYKDHRAPWLFFGDASSRARKTSAARSDYAMIKSDSRFKDSKVFYPKANPPVADRVAAVNRMLRSASGERKLLISPKCVHTIRDLGYLAYIEGSREIDKRDPDSGHISDALGYPIHKIFPVRYNSGGSGEVYVG
jgi:hypothetical protein